MVTGAGSGIGRDTALLLHALGARLSLVDRDEEGLAGLGVWLGDDASAVTHVADLSDIEGIEPLVARCVAAGGLLHGVVHCAGVQAVNPVRTLQPVGWRRVFAVNTEAGLMLAKAVSGRKAYAGDNGSLVFISSVGITCVMPLATRSEDDCRIVASSSSRWASRGSCSDVSGSA